MRQQTFARYPRALTSAVSFPTFPSATLRSRGLATAPAATTGPPPPEDCCRRLLAPTGRKPARASIVQAVEWHHCELSDCGLRPAPDSMHRQPTHALSCGAAPVCTAVCGAGGCDRTRSTRLCGRGRAAPAPAPAASCPWSLASALDCAHRTGQLSAHHLPLLRPLPLLLLLLLPTHTPGTSGSTTPADPTRPACHVVGGRCQRLAPP